MSVEDHIADITAAIEGADEPVILVAHSYGGRPATGAWDRARDNIAHLVWVEAVVPLDDSPIAIPGDDDSLAFVVMMYPDIADSGMFPPSPTLTEEPGRPLAPMSLRSLYGPVTVDAPLPPIPGTYIYAEDSSLPALRQYGEHIAARLGWTLASIPGAMMSCATPNPNCATRFSGWPIRSLTDAPAPPAPPSVPPPPPRQSSWTRCQ